MCSGEPTCIRQFHSHIKDGLTDRQTDRQTDRLIVLLCFNIEKYNEKVIKTKNQSIQVHSL